MRELAELSMELGTAFQHSGPARCGRNGLESRAFCVIWASNRKAGPVRKGPRIASAALLKRSRGNCIAMLTAYTDPFAPIIACVVGSRALFQTMSACDLPVAAALLEQIAAAWPGRFGPADAPIDQISYDDRLALARFCARAEAARYYWGTTPARLLYDDALAGVAANRVAGCATGRVMRARGLLERVDDICAKLAWQQLASAQHMSNGRRHQRVLAIADTIAASGEYKLWLDEDARCSSMEMFEVSERDMRVDYADWWARSGGEHEPDYPRPCEIVRGARPYNLASAAVERRPKRVYVIC